MRSLKRSQFRISGLLVLAIIVILPASAANVGGIISYRISGIGTERPLEEALVTVYNVKTQAKAVTRSNNRGEYLITSLSSGDYIILVEKDGRRLYQGRVEVQTAETRRDIKL